MRIVHWGEALNSAFQYQERDKVLLVMFADEECEICNMMLPIIEEQEAIYPEHYEVLVVKDQTGFPFPPSATPIGFAFIPRCPDKMPLKRVGAAPPEAIIQDIGRQVKAFKTGKSYKELVDEENSNK